MRAAPGRMAGRFAGAKALSILTIYALLFQAFFQAIPAVSQAASHDLAAVFCAERQAGEPARPALPDDACGCLALCTSQAFSPFTASDPRITVALPRVGTLLREPLAVEAGPRSAGTRRHSIRGPPSAMA